MKSIAVTSLLALLLATSCKKDSATTVSCGSVTATYAANVLPIIQSSCATGSSCHATGSSRGPGALTTYQQIYNCASIRSSVVSGSMPENGSLSAAQINTIACWIDNGAANN